jgi:protein-S-isoprenylcysteine O-methyltransferase Ste14
MGSRAVRPSTTHSTAALWVKSLLNAFLFFCIFMVALPWLANWLLPTPVPLPSWLQLLGGGALFLLGVVTWIICLDIFSRRGRGTPFPLDAPRNLVTTGPFAVVRNPIMAAEILVIWAEAFYFSSLGILLYAVLATVAGHLSVVYVEEPELRERFGEQYEAYCRRVPRWFPRLRPENRH